MNPPFVDGRYAGGDRVEPTGTRGSAGRAAGTGAGGRVEPGVVGELAFRDGAGGST